jgi:hypothetical protein|tara:strand:+ start:28138 stop:28701 length:564 start_codon:yes stop_codon:yes gene_type:complete
MKHIFFLFTIIIFFLNPATVNCQIQKLQTGVLLIRLQTNQHLIDYYAKNDLNKMEEILQKQIKKNNDIINTFHNEWSLCPVYFFYSNNSEEILQKDFTNLINHRKETLSREEISSIKENFLIGYLGKDSGSLKFHALILRNHDLSKLRPPLPRFVRTYKGLWFLSRKLSKTINILEKKVDFYISRKK